MNDAVLWHERVTLTQANWPLVDETLHSLVGFAVNALATGHWFVVDTADRKHPARVYECPLTRISRAEVEGWSAERSEYGWRWTTGFLHGATVHGATTGLTVHRDDGRWLQFRLSGPPVAVKPRLDPFLAAVGMGTTAPAAPLPPPGGAAHDIAGQLTQLAALRDAGTLTADEFDTAKRRLLGS